MATEKTATDQTATGQTKRASQALLTLDKTLHDAARPYADNPLVKALAACGKLGDQPPMLVLSGAVLAGGVAVEEPRMIRAGTRMLVAHVLATGVKNAIKNRVDRHRPATEPGEQAPKPEKGRDESKAMTSFPSGHTAGAVAVARAFGRAYPEHAGKAMAGAGVIAVAQVVGGKHYLTDVIVGTAIGLAAETVCTMMAPVRR